MVIGKLLALGEILHESSRRPIVVKAAEDAHEKKRHLTEEFGLKLGMLDWAIGVVRTLERHAGRSRCRPH